MKEKEELAKKYVSLNKSFEVINNVTVITEQSSESELKRVQSVEVKAETREEVNEEKSSMPTEQQISSTPSKRKRKRRNKNKKANKKK